MKLNYRMIIKKTILSVITLITVAILISCNAEDKSKQGRNINKDDSTRKETPLEKTNKDINDKIIIKNGQILDRDIIPELSKVYGITEEEVREAFSSAESFVINNEIEDFRKMEGIIVPGELVLKENINKQVDWMVKQAEDRYKDIVSSVDNKNSLNDKERIILASIIEAECLAGKDRQKTADVFLNRLNNKSKLQSCVTAEYALEYQRPYLTYEDIEIDSEYNTYKKEGLPIGAIASFSDESLKVASGVSTDTKLEYFFYDYVIGEMNFFSDYEEFNNEGEETIKRFESESEVQKFDKINKQELYGN